MAIHVKGHPIHTMLVAFPIGLYAFSFIFDCVYFAGRGLGWYQASYLNLVFGLVMTIPTALFGLLDFTHIEDDRARTTGVYHLVVNVVATLIFFISLLVRSVYSPGPSVLTAPVAGIPWFVAFSLSFIALAFLVVGGWFGGDLVFRHRVGVGLEAPPARAPRRSALGATDGQTGPEPAPGLA